MGAGIFVVALTDQLDGYLARRWHVESRFGQVATRSRIGS